MKDFLDELDTELEWLPSASSSKPKTKTLQANTPKTQKPVFNDQKKTTTSSGTKTHSGAPTGAKKKNPAKKQHTGKQQKKPQPKNNSWTKKNTNAIPSSRASWGSYGIEFPEIKFYLPSLREGYTRYIPIGGNNEIGAKNMGMFQYKDDILLVDCGVQFAEPEMLGASYSIPDVSFLTKYTKNIKGFLITHAHLDHIGAIKDILPALDYPTLYGTKLTIGLIKKQLQEKKILDKATLVVVDASVEKKLKIGEFTVEYFNVNHSIPDCAGIYIESPGGTKIVHTGDIKIDMTPAIDAPADLKRYEEIGKRGIDLFLSDSTGSIKKGFSTSEKPVGEELEKIVSQATQGRVFIATFSSWLSRVQQLADICEKHDKQIFLTGRSMVENVAIAKELWYIKCKPGTIRKMTSKNLKEVPNNKQVIITTWSQWEEFSALTRMAEWKHPHVEIQADDTVVFSSSVVPGNERSVSLSINKLIKYGVKVITKDDALVHTSGHGYQEEQKMLLRLFNPKYFSPIFWDLYFRTIHKETAKSIWWKEDNILMLDNGNIVDFAPSGTVFRSKIKVPIQDLIVDGHGVGTADSHVIKAREKMMNSGVLVLLLRVDKKTKAILGHIKLETRGLAYIDEVRHIHRILIKKTREVYENTIKDIPDIEEKDLLKIIRSDLESFLLKRIDREPMIIPMITEV